MSTYFVPKPGNPEKLAQIQNLIAALDENFPGQMTITEAIRVDTLADVEKILGPILEDISLNFPIAAPKPAKKTRQPKEEPNSNFGENCRFTLPTGEMLDWDAMKEVIRSGKLKKGDIVTDGADRHLKVTIGRGGRINLVPTNHTEVDHA